MNFVEQNKVVGHLTIVKIDSRTKKEEVVYDDSNVICGGMGRSIAQFMSLSGCDLEECGVSIPGGDACNLKHYQISKYQVGVGASGTTATSSVVGLVSPLSYEDYGGDLKSVQLDTAALYSESNVMISEAETFGILSRTGKGTSSMTHIWLMDEETANGQRIDEAGLFVENPYLKSKEATSDVNSLQISLLGDTGSDSQPESDADTEEVIYAPGHLLCAYKQFSPIYKENYFSLLFRWKITFLQNNFLKKEGRSLLLYQKQTLLDQAAAKEDFLGL